jgi:type I restriction enzyme, S subunit
MNATQLLEHFDRLAEAPDAVPRLRRFILDLAVRGKLVEQDAADEPASMLLKQIEGEIARLVKIGEMRKPKALPPIEIGEEPFDAPTGWCWVRIRQVTSDRGQTTPVGDFTYIDVGSINKEAGVLGEHKILSASDAPSRARKIVGKGDVLYSCVRPTLLNIAVVEDEIKPTPIASTAFAVINSFGLVVPRYLWIALRSPYLEGIVESGMRGQAYPAINDSEFAQLPLALPPLSEQHRIVAKVDELMALCDQLEAAQQERERRRDRLAAASLQRLNQPAADTTPEAQREHARFHLQHLPRLTTRPEHIKAMRQLLVNIAVAGKLAHSEPNEEPAEVLLKKVWAEKMSRGLLKQTNASREENLDLKVNSLPAGWAWTTFESFATEIATGPFGSALHQSDYIDGGIPLVNPSHMIDGRIVANPKISVTDDTAAGLASYRMKSGDVVMARRGEVGRAAIVTAAEAGWLCGTGSFFVSFHEEIDRQFVILLLRSDTVRRYLAGEAVGTTMVNLNHGIIKRIPLALPPAAEQHRIVAKVDELMALCDQLEAQLTTTQTDSRRLLEAVLEAALMPA